MERKLSSSKNTQVMYTQNAHSDTESQTKIHTLSNSKEKITVKDLKLKLEKKVTWTEDTIDNEHMNKKKSKICCIFKKPITNPDDSSSDSCSSCDEKGKNAYERPTHYDRKKVK
jgi:hypothetical protein